MAFKLDKLQKSKLKNLMSGDDWDLIELLVARKVAELNAQPITGTNAFETLRALHIKEGKVQSLQLFLDELEQVVLD